MCGKHWVGFLGLFEEAALPASFSFHHQIVMFGLHYSRLFQVIVHIALIARVQILSEHQYYAVSNTYISCDKQIDACLSS